MDQEKMGSFLKELRAEKGLTQAELAERLNTTNRSVSRWETGHTMPDISILIELAAFYRVDIKEILDGERKREPMNEDSRETAEKVAAYSKKTNKKKVAKTVLLMLIPIIILSVLFVIVFSSRSMELFPERYPAYQQVHIDKKITDRLINDYVIKQMPAYSDDSRNFAVNRVFAAEEKQSGDYYVYAWILESAYSYKAGVLAEEGGSSYPCRFELAKEDDGFRVVGADAPRDGGYYAEDIKKLFPGYVVEMIDKVQEDGTVRGLSEDLFAEAKACFGVE